MRSKYLGAQVIIPNIGKFYISKLAICSELKAGQIGSSKFNSGVKIVMGLYNTEQSDA